MAKPNKTEMNETALDPEIQKMLDAAIAAEGVKKDDAIEYRGLTPIYAPASALDLKWPPLVGKFDRIERLPTIRAGKDNEYTPIMIRVVLTQATKALSGTSESAQAVDMAVGDEVLLPVTGGIGVNRKLEAAASDRDFVHTLIAVVTGKREIGQPQPMFDFKVIGLGKKEKRVGRFAEPLQYRNFDGVMFEAAPVVPQITAANGAAAQA